MKGSYPMGIHMGRGCFVLDHRVLPRRDGVSGYWSYTARFGTVAGACVEKGVDSPVM